MTGMPQEPMTDDAVLGGQNQPKSNDAVQGSQRARSRYARTPDEYVIHLLIAGGHREQVRFATIQEFQKWYSGDFLPKASSTDFVSVPIKNVQGEYIVVRPASILAIRVEPVFAGSVERDY